jgi:hypothetical protein
LEVSEFQHALHRGLGRAILHLQKHDSTPYRDVILQACLKNTTYDRQVEGGKSVYMTHIIELTGDKEFYRHQILDAARKIGKDTDSYNREHVLDLVQSFAHEGDMEARQIIYDAFANNPTSDDEWGAYRIIELDELEGFLFVAETFGQRVVVEPDAYPFDFLLSVFEEIVGKEVATDKLNLERQNRPHVDVYLKAMETVRAKQQKRRTLKPKARIPYAEIKQNIEMNVSTYYQAWGNNTDSESLIQAASDLIDILKQDDIIRLRKYLRIFWHRAFPLDVTPILKLVDYQDEGINYPSLPVSALNVLGEISHPSVRELALKLIAENRFTGRAVELLNRNFEADDWQRLEEITKRDLDKEDYHSLEMSVREVFREHSTQEATQTLLNLYENGICSHCRYDTVASLHSIDALPTAIREECLYDSYEDTRELAQRNFEPKAK